MLGKDLNFADCQFNDGEVVEVRWLSPEQIISEMDTTPERWGVMVDSFKKIVPLLKHGRN
jgi:isopentenyldiphosphate isomerase